MHPHSGDRSSSPSSGSSKKSRPKHKEQWDRRLLSYVRKKLESETFSDNKMSDWATYVKDSEGDADVIISAVFPDKRSAGNALAAEESRLTTGGGSILFSCLLRETARREGVAG